MFTGSALFASMGDHEQFEAFHQLQLQHQQMCDEGNLKSRSQELTGANIDHHASLWGIMGDIEPLFTKKQHEYDQMRSRLKSSGKSDEAIDKIFKDEFEKAIKGNLRIHVIKLYSYTHLTHPKPNSKQFLDYHLNFLKKG